MQEMNQELKEFLVLDKSDNRLGETKVVVTDSKTDKLPETGDSENLYHIYGMILIFLVSLGLHVQSRKTED